MWLQIFKMHMACSCYSSNCTPRKRIQTGVPQPPWCLPSHRGSYALLVFGAAFLQMTYAHEASVFPTVAGPQYLQMKRHRSHCVMYIKMFFICRKNPSILAACSWYESNTNLCTSRWVWGSFRNGYIVTFNFRLSSHSLGWRWGLLLAEEMRFSTKGGVCAFGLVVMTVPNWWAIVLDPGAPPMRITPTGLKECHVTFIRVIATGTPPTHFDLVTLLLVKSLR